MKIGIERSNNLKSQHQQETKNEIDLIERPFKDHKTSISIQSNLTSRSFRSIGVPLHLLIIQINPHHGLPQSAAHFRHNLRIAVMRNGLHDRARPPRGIAALKNPGPDENPVAPQLHHERGVGGRRDAACGKVHDGEPPELLRLHDEIVGRGDLLGEGEDLVVVHVAEDANVAHDGADVAHGLDDVAGAGLALGADHGGALADAAQGLAEVAAAADEGDAEVVLVDVVVFVSDGEDFGLVDVVDAEGFEDLGFDEVADAGFGHDGYGDGPLDFFDEGGVGHAGDAALCADVGGDAFQRHDRACARLFGDAGLLRVHHVHYDAAAEHLSEAYFYRER
eukprot:TRINITY_DN2911_c0_g3_i1.p1 TRINITY_DN2911_c0_g3~~TRINITY_DN2911_c0_g3_i1.p1  ORF type:complete len:336 (+),score=10.47 TRINITY_DN2911_c0_g3_i1:113-1120(+)